MPTAPPSSRTVSLSAEATPCFSTGQRLGDRRRRRAHARGRCRRRRSAGRAGPTGSRPTPTPSSPAGPGRRRTGRRRSSSVAARADPLGDRRGDGRQRHHHRPPSAAARRRHRAPSSPSTACRNCTSTRKMPNITANTMSRVSEPAARPRSANRRSSQQRVGLAQLPDDEADQRQRRRRSGRPASAGRSSPARDLRGCRGRAPPMASADSTEPTVSKRPVVILTGVADDPQRHHQRDDGEQRSAWRTATAR